MFRRDRMIRLVIDSGTDQNEWFQDNFNFGFIPLTIILEEKAYLDKKDISQKELHRFLREGKFAATSQPSPGEVMEILETYRKNKDQVIIVSVWKKISGTYQVIKSVVEEYKEKYPDFKVTLIDSNSGSGAATILSIQILEMIDAGYDYEEIVEQAQWNAEHLSIYLTVEDLKWLVKSGRLSGVAGFIGSALKVKPLLTVDDEKIYADGMVRGNKRIYKKMVERIKEDTQSFPEQLYCISHVGEKENAEALEQLIKEEIPTAKTMIFDFGAVLAAHIGIGGVAVAAMTEKPKNYLLSEN